MAPVIFEAQCVANIRRAGKSKRNWTANGWLLERKFPQRYGKTDRHLIHTEREGVPLSEAYIAAVSRALGITGKLIPCHRRLPAPKVLPDLPDEPMQDEVIDLEVLPN